MKGRESAHDFLEANIVLPLEIAHPNGGIVQSPLRITALRSEAITGLYRLRREHEQGLLLNC